MFIDINVHPAFFEIVNQDKKRENLRHEVLNIHHNGTASLDHIFNQMACAGLDKLALMPEDYSSTEDCIVVTNEEIKTIVDAAPDRFIGFASVDPGTSTFLSETERAFTDLSLQGLALYPARQYFYPNDPKFDALYTLCEAYDKPIMFQGGFSYEPRTLSKYSHPLHFEEVAIKHPKLRFCLSGFAWPWVRETAMLLLKYPNTYADTSVLFFDSAREFFLQTFTKDIPATWIDRSLRHQVMFGSNNPRFEQIRMAQSLSSLDYRESTLDLIRGENARCFLNI